jgi:hypothetical protein
MRTLLCSVLFLCSSTPPPRFFSTQRRAEKAEKKAKKAAKKAKEGSFAAEGDGDSEGDNEGDIEDESVFQFDDVVANDDDETINALVSQFKGSLKVGQSAKEVVGEVARLQTISSLSLASRLEIFVKGVFGADMRKQIPDMIGALKLLVTDVESQARLICLVEELTVAFPNLVKPFPLLLKALYDEDVLEEEQLLSWGSADHIRGPYSSKALSDDELQALRAASKPFMEWLEQAEEDGDDEDDDDDDE